MRLTCPEVTVPDPPTTDLVRRALSGDASAFVEIHRRFARAVHGVVLARGPAEDADDACQEAFVQAWRRLGTLRDAGALGPWLLSIARNIAVDRLRSRMRDGRHEELHDDGAPARPIGNDRELRERTMAHIRALPEAYRETLILRLVEGLDGPEIAAQTGLTHGSVRVNLTRGMELLRARLRKDGWP